MRFQPARIAVLAAAVCASSVGTAQASGTLSVSGTRLVWTGGSGADTLTVSGFAQPRPAPQPADETVTFRSSSAIAVGATATAVCGEPATLVTCERVVPAGRVDVVEADGMGGVDTLSYDDGSIIGPIGIVSIPVDFDGGTGDDTLFGSSVADVELRGGLGADTIDGEAGNDFIDGDDTDTGTTDGADALDGGRGDDNVDGQGGSDADRRVRRQRHGLAGGPGNDTIQGGDGEDNITGGDDEDSVIAGPENDVVDGGTGNADRLRYDEPTRGGAVVVDLSTGTAGKDGGPGEITEDALNFERVTGTALGDTIRGDAQGNVLDGAAGDDFLSARAGATRSTAASGSTPSPTPSARPPHP